ncbi:MAG: serine hydrolase [Deltaproteobacteria bacterium]|nr:serine hydrolase [Deltaproteobacteria bacterium]
MTVEQVLSDAVGDGITPGAAAVVVTGDGRRRLALAGHLHRLEGAPAVDERTVWDLASLTKLLSTTLLVARAVDRGTLALDLEPWPARWPGITVAHLLRHDAGLPDWRPLFEAARKAGVCGLPAGARAVVAAALEVAPEAAPGARTLYSDVGFIALGALLEERLGTPLDRAFAQAAGAYGATGLRFVRLDTDGFHPAVPLVAPTERCLWRRRALFGQVHDDNAFAMGGVAGHAGLFGSLLDVEAAAGFYLRALTEPGEETLASFAATGGERGLGFDRATPEGTTAGALSPRAVGHLGFTGTSLFMDPAPPGAAYVLLTNRVHESREHKQRIFGVRRAFHQAAAAWVASGSA